MVMADDENSDLAGYVAEQKVVKGNRANSLFGQGRSLASKHAKALPTNPLPNVKL
jgi:hypothetical protein